jgi:hypothetical protein
MFAGVGSFSILIACHSKARKVFSIDISPVAVDLMCENARLNRVEGKLAPILGDAKDAVERHLKNTADRVIMPLPQKALAYLDYALMALKPSGGWIHYYEFKHASKTCWKHINKSRAATHNNSLPCIWKYSGRRYETFCQPKKLLLFLHGLGCILQVDMQFAYDPSPCVFLLFLEQCPQYPFRSRCQTAPDDGVGAGLRRMSRNILRWLILLMVGLSVLGAGEAHPVSAAPTLVKELNLVRQGIPS